MMMGKRIAPLLVLALLLGVVMPVEAQKGKLRKAAQMMEALQYRDAAAVYERILEKREGEPTATRELAEAYRKSGQLAQAESWYARALNLPDVEPIYFYYYGKILLQNGKCEEAQAAFNEFLRRKPYDSRAAVLGEVCAYRARLLERGAQRTAVDLPGFNTRGSDLGPAFFGDGLVFGSVRRRAHEEVAFYDLYFTRPQEVDSGNGQVLRYDTVEAFSALLNSEVNEAIVAFSADTSEVFFTRNQPGVVSDRYPVRRLEILMARRLSDGNWSEPAPLPFNSADYSTAHPALSPDGTRLFFSSDRPGGFGGKDLWVSGRIGETWGSPVNLGPTINTEGDELYPFYHSSGELYFASDGHLGLGGQDVFRSEDLGSGIWSLVDNLGFPINTAADDFGLIMADNGKRGYFTSNRRGGVGGDDIYAFRPRKVWIDVQLAAPEDRQLDRSVALALRGQGEPLIPDGTGSWSGWLDYNACWYLTVVSPIYAPEEREVCASTAGLSDTLSIRWPLRPRAVVSPSEVDTFSQGNQLRGIVLNGLSEEPIPGAQLRVSPNDCGEALTFNTNSDGTFSFAWKAGCCYDLRVAAAGHFTQNLHNLLCVEGTDADSVLVVYLSPYRLTTSQTLEPRNRERREEEPAPFQVGARTYDDEATAIPYLLNVYYDLGRASVRPEAIPELNKLLRLMEDNPDIKLEISSHTDSRGATALNERLSDRRARAIVNWLVNKGIDAERLIAKGYGETRLVNDCVDGVDCEEEAHQLNRRTEFRVLELK